MTSLYEKNRFDYSRLILTGGGEKNQAAQPSVQPTEQPPAYPCPQPPQMNLQSNVPIGSNQTLDSVLPQMFEHQIQIKMLHFQTIKFGWHEALDEYLDKFNQNFDRLMESAQGLTKNRLTAQNININVNIIQDNINSVNQEFDKFMSILQHNIPNCTQDLGLMTVRDEMVADLNQLKYRLTFQ